MPHLCDLQEQAMTSTHPTPCPQNHAGLSQKSVVQPAPSSSLPSAELCSSLPESSAPSSSSAMAAKWPRPRCDAASAACVMTGTMVPQKRRRRCAQLQVGYHLSTASALLQHSICTCSRFSRTGMPCYTCASRGEQSSRCYHLDGIHSGGGGLVALMPHKTRPQRLQQILRQQATLHEPSALTPSVQSSYHIHRRDCALRSTGSTQAHAGRPHGSQQLHRLGDEPVDTQGSWIAHRPRTCRSRETSSGAGGLESR